jgi:hypothetical protein
VAEPPVPPEPLPITILSASMDLLITIENYFFITSKKIITIIVNKNNAETPDKKAGKPRDISNSFFCKAVLSSSHTK